MKHPPAIQAFLITCGDKHFAETDGFKESLIKSLLDIDGVDLYEDRYAGGAAVVLRSATAKDFLAEEITTYINGPIADRVEDEGPVEEVWVIATVHRSCGGCKPFIGELFGTDAEIAALEDILRAEVAPVIEDIRDAVGFRIRAIGLVLEHNGAPLGKIIDLNRVLIG